MSAQARKAALEALADHHDIEQTCTTSSGEDLVDLLETPEEIEAWCAVTFSPEHEITYLYPHYDNIEDARAKAGEYIADPTFAETPEEIVNLDTGERHTAHVGIVGWSKEVAR